MTYVHTHVRVYILFIYSKQHCDDGVKLLQLFEAYQRLPSANPLRQRADDVADVWLSFLSLSLSLFLLLFCFFQDANDEVDDDV